MTAEQIWNSVLTIYGSWNVSYLFVHVVLDGKRFRFVSPEEICVADIAFFVFMFPAFILYCVIYAVFFAVGWIWEKSQIPSLLRWKPFAPALKKRSALAEEMNSKGIRLGPSRQFRMIRTKGTNRILTVESVANGGVYAINLQNKLEWFDYCEIEEVLSLEIRLLVDHPGLQAYNMGKGSIVVVKYISGSDYMVIRPDGLGYLVYKREAEINKVIVGEFNHDC